jgi:hypothetical protein
MMCCNIQKEMRHIRYSFTHDNLISCESDIM